MLFVRARNGAFPCSRRRSCPGMSGAARPSLTPRYEADRWHKDWLATWQGRRRGATLAQLRDGHGAGAAPGGNAACMVMTNYYTGSKVTYLLHAAAPISTYPPPRPSPPVPR